jgi:hypothetical protein
VFRFLGRLIVALLALLAARIFFATMRRAFGGGRGGGSARRPSGAADATNEGVSGAPRRAPAARPPRIDPGAAEDVPYVEIEREPSARR